jgi:replicative DNA helicase
MKWQDMSEVVAGMCLRTITDPKNKIKIDPNAVNPMLLYPPYDEIIPMLRDGKEMADIAIKVGTTAVNTAILAADTVNGGVPPLQFLKALTELATKAMAAEKLEPMLKALKNGDNIDLGAAMKVMSDVEFGYTELTPMSSVIATKGVWLKTGYQPWDDNIGGLPAAGLTIVGASPGVGKTTLMLGMVTKMAQLKENKKKYIAVFTLEMIMSQLTMRAMELSDVPKTVQDRILLGDGSYTVQEVYAVASRTASQYPLAMIAIDFADQMVEGEQTEAAMGVIYKTLAQLAKKTGIPVLLISQLNRSTYAGGIPKINHLRYSGLAEAMAALIVLIYNPSNILVDIQEKTKLDIIPGRGYLIVGKSRFGFKKGGPGAIMIDWEPETGWGNTCFGYFELTG